jgi:hypothetical protein
VENNTQGDDEMLCPPIAFTLALLRLWRHAKVMGMKEDTVRHVGFARLAILRPGIIVGNAHTPTWVGWLGSLVPGPFGNIDQRILGRSIAAEIALHSRERGEVIRENAANKNSLRSSRACLKGRFQDYQLGHSK